MGKAKKDQLSQCNPENNDAMPAIRILAERSWRAVLI